MNATEFIGYLCTAGAFRLPDIPPLQGGVYRALLENAEQFREDGHLFSQMLLSLPPVLSVEAAKDHYREYAANLRAFHDKFAPSALWARIVTANLVDAASNPVDNRCGNKFGLQITDDAPGSFLSAGWHRLLVAAPSHCSRASAIHPTNRA